jgi:Xaa-Pro aminopeptidase
MRRDEFGKRRRLLMRHMGRDAIAILPAAPVRTRNNDVEYHYRPDSDFYYLTSFTEPEAVAVLIPGRPQGEYVLFVRDRDPAREAWDGAAGRPRRRGPRLRRRRRLSRRRHRRDPAGPARAPARASSTPMGAHPEFDKRVIGWINALRSQGQARHAARRTSSWPSTTRCTRCALQEPRRARLDAPLGRHRLRGAPARRAVRGSRAGWNTR